MEADSGGGAEAGTTQKDVVRLGVVNIAVSFSVSPKWLKLQTGLKQKKKIQVKYFDPETCGRKQAEMYVDGFKAKLEKDIDYRGLRSVGFDLKEM